MGLKATITGVSDYAGGEVACLLVAHLEIEVTMLTVASSTGRLLGEPHPQIGSLAEFEIQETSVETLSGYDLMIPAPPHGYSVVFAEKLDASGGGILVLGCVAGHRFIKAEDWAEYYGGGSSPAWTYGMSEPIHAREPLVCAQGRFLAVTCRIVVPGCNVTAVTLTLQSAVHTGLVDMPHIAATFTVGYSGIGKSMKSYPLASQVPRNMAFYAASGAYRHAPEIVQNLVLARGDKESMCLNFTPVPVPTSHGVFATVVAPPAEGVREESVKEAYTVYEGEALIIVTPDGVWPTNGPMTGTGPARVKAVIDAKVGTLTAIVAIDNLGRGTTAAVVQSANIILRLEEYLDVSMIGIVP